MRSVRCPFCGEYFIVFKGYEDKIVICPHCGVEIVRIDWDRNYWAFVRRRWQCPNCEEIFDACYFKDEPWSIEDMRCGKCGCPSDMRLLYEGIVRIKRRIQRRLHVVKGKKFGISKFKDAKVRLGGENDLTWYVMILGTKSRGWYKECKDQVEAVYWYDKFMNPPADLQEAYAVVIVKQVRKREWGERLHLLKEKEVSESESDSNVLQQEEGEAPENSNTSIEEV